MKVLMCIILIISAALFFWIFLIFLENFDSASPNVKAGIIGVAGTVTAAFLINHHTKKREIASRHFTDKRNGYMNFIDALFEILVDVKSGKNPQNTRTERKMLEFKKSLLTWGSPSLIEDWINYEKNAENESLSERQKISEMDKIIRAIRKDLGHRDTSLKDGDLISIILQPEAREQLLGGNTS